LIVAVTINPQRFFPYYVLVGSPLQLTCAVTESDRPELLNWKAEPYGTEEPKTIRNGENGFEVHRDNISRTTELTKERFTMDDEARYKCITQSGDSHYALDVAAIDCEFFLSNLWIIHVLSIYYKKA